MTAAAQPRDKYSLIVSAIAVRAKTTAINGMAGSEQQQLRDPSPVESSQGESNRIQPDMAGAWLRMLQPPQNCVLILQKENMTPKHWILINYIGRDPPPHRA
ncbi:hypothetical protein TWF706_009301, partial [Orbilia oligospora]